jgi:hypothetical protein
MKRVARVLRLAPGERRLLLEAFALLGVISPVLKFGSGKLTGRLIRRASTAVAGHADAKVAFAVAAAVNQAGLHVPGATCLARALTGWLMVTRRHQPATLRLGVHRADSDEFAAHAWLECNGQSVIGGERVHEYTPFPTFS